MTVAVPHPEALQLAAQVLYFTRRGDWVRASAALSQVGQLGNHAQLTLIYAITDAALMAQFDFRGSRPRPGQIAAPIWHDIRGHVITTDAEQVPAAVRWVGRFFTARAVMDQELCHDLLRACSGDEEWSARVNRLVEMAALTLNTLQGVPS